MNEPELATAAWALATSLTSLELLAEGSPCPRENLKPDVLLLLGEPLHGPDFTISVDTAQRLTLATEKWGTLDSAIEAAKNRPQKQAWPAISHDAFHGLAGEIVATIAPTSEADPIGLLAQLLVGFGNLVGRNPHFQVEADRHGSNLNAVLVGVTSKGRKGTSWSHIRHLLSTVDITWADRVHSGLSSGEGLIWHVRDPITEDDNGDEKVIDPGVTDKRLLVAETELATTLKVLSRDGNTLSPVLRRAWDDGDLQTLTKNSPARATEAHISLIGHITAEELQRYLDSTEMANGLANRFLWMLVRRSQILPRGGRPDTHLMAQLAWKLSNAAQTAREITVMDRDDAAYELWDIEYERLSTGRPGLVGALTSRGEAQVLRLALIYALLDQSPLIRTEHLRAGLALWRYNEASVVTIFGESTGNPDADVIMRALKNTPAGLTRTDISELFGRKASTTRISQALGLLLEHSLATMNREETGGRPVERWLPTLISPAPPLENGSTITYSPLSPYFVSSSRKEIVNGSHRESTKEGVKGKEGMDTGIEQGELSEKSMVEPKPKTRPKITDPDADIPF